MDTMVDTWRELAEAFIRAIEGRDFAAIEAMLAPDIRFRALVPRRERAASSAPEARMIVGCWTMSAMLLFGSRRSDTGL